MFSLIFFLIYCLSIQAEPKAKNKKPHIIFILQDDLGRFDAGVYDQNEQKASGNLTHIASSEGIRLKRHYTHWHCSPTRRSFLSGRLPLHHGEQLSAVAGDDMDLRWSWISDKLKSVGYQNYWYGKGHTGYKSMHHLPNHHGFDDHFGFLSGAGSYTTIPRWSNDIPVANNTEYSTDLFGRLALTAVEKHDPDVPMFLYLPFQAVHSPYDVPPNSDDWDLSPILKMQKDADEWAGALISALKEKRMWDNTLLVFSSDNGGVDSGNNWPLRGEKHTSWQGGMQVVAFVSGGLVPKNLRGSSNDMYIHIVDWYPTFCALAGVEASDDSPTPPKKVDPKHPDIDIYGKDTWPGLDGVNIWPMLMNPDKYNLTSAHQSMVLSREVFVQGNYKIVVAQPNPNVMAAKQINNGWKTKENKWNNTGAGEEETGCNKYNNRHIFEPCLFDIINDPREENDLASQQPTILEELWKALNNSWLGEYKSRTPKKMLGKCDSKCAGKHWKSITKSSNKKYNSGPICGVPGCDKYLFEY